MSVEWKSSEATDWKKAIDDYDDKLESGELKFDSKGDLIPDPGEPETPGWLHWLYGKLPPDNFSRPP